MSILWIIALAMIVLWLLGFGLLPALGYLVHLLLVVAIIVVLIRLIRGR
ncbi:MAG: lmo0937 family membrane protein [archaeon]